MDVDMATAPKLAFEYIVKKPNYCGGNTQRGELPTRQHRISHRQLFQAGPGRDTLIDVFVMPAQQPQFPTQTNPHGIVVPKRSTAC